MTGFALVRNGAVEQVNSSLPATHFNVSGFNKLDTAEAKAYGFLPYTYVQPEYDPFTQRLGDTTFEITADEVIGTRQILPLEQADVDAQKENITKDVIKALNQVLYNTDWTQMPASGLTVPQAAAYAEIRASIVAAKSLIGNISVKNADAARQKIARVLEDSSSRSAAVPASLVTLKNTLDNLA